MGQKINCFDWVKSSTKEIDRLVYYKLAQNGRGKIERFFEKRDKVFVG